MMADELKEQNDVDGKVSILMKDHKHKTSTKFVMREVSARN